MYHTSRPRAADHHTIYNTHTISNLTRISQPLTAHTILTYDHQEQKTLSEQDKVQITSTDQPGGATALYSIFNYNSNLNLII